MNTQNTGMPVTYLGPFKNRSVCQEAYRRVPNGEAHYLEQFLLNREWDGANIDREVKRSDFVGNDPEDTSVEYIRNHPGLKGYVFPGVDKIKTVCIFSAQNNP